ncbi:hypothetical protein [Streptomyces mirabilis]|uniref:hypothetical protein n=1 Tax=Streptomyces mirabilis TaxID=68239 RepID=UPI0034133731
MKPTRTTGVIGTRVPAGLLPHRRPCISTRKVRSSVSRYAERQGDGRPGTSRLVTDLDVTILEPDPDLPTVSSRTTIDTHRPSTGADSASWTSFTQNPTASGTPATPLLPPTEIR